jgi:hypothetical protein
MMPMVYDSCRDPETVDGPGAAAAVACAYTAGGASLSTVAGLERVAADYLTFGVHPSQLAPTINWFSNDFACVDPDDVKKWDCKKFNCHTWTNADGCMTAGPNSPSFHGIPNPVRFPSPPSESESNQLFGARVLNMMFSSCRAMGIARCSGQQRPPARRSLTTPPGITTSTVSLVSPRAPFMRLRDTDELIVEPCCPCPLRAVCCLRV